MKTPCNFEVDAITVIAKLSSLAAMLNHMGTELNDAAAMKASVSAELTCALLSDMLVAHRAAHHPAGGNDHAMACATAAKELIKQQQATEEAFFHVDPNAGPDVPAYDLDPMDFHPDAAKPFIPKSGKGDEPLN